MGSNPWQNRGPMISSKMVFFLLIFMRTSKHVHCNGPRPKRERNYSMEMNISLGPDHKITARWDGFEVTTDQPTSQGGGGIGTFSF